MRAETDLMIARLRAEGQEQAERSAARRRPKRRASMPPHTAKTPSSIASSARSTPEKMLGRLSTVVLDTDSPPFDVLKRPVR